MGTIPQTPGRQFLADLKAMERRIADLERGERAPATSMRGGSFQILDDDGNPRIVLGDLGDGLFGLAALDADGLTRARLGLLDTGEYGLGVLNASGTLVNLGDYVFGIRADEVATTEATSSTSLTDLATVGPEVTVDVGPTGKVIVAHTAFIGLNAGGMTGFAAVMIDGVFAVSTGVSTQTAQPIAASAGGTRLVEGLSPGSHTFRMKYSVTSGSANFSNRGLVVQPV
jgi:hypothetical protein